ncbi:MAG: hypothetical protein U1E65_31305 [Myxococcota bacterium]
MRAFSTVLCALVAGCGGSLPAPEGPRITTTALTEAVLGQPYQATLTADRGKPPYRWRLLGPESSAAPGISLGAEGSLSGTPTAAGRFVFLAEVAGADDGVSSTALSLTVRASTQTVPLSARCDGALTLPLIDGSAAVETSLPRVSGASPDLACGRSEAEATQFFAIDLGAPSSLQLSLSGSGARAGILEDHCPAISAALACGTQVRAAEVAAGRALVVVVGPPGGQYRLTIEATAIQHPPGDPLSCEAPGTINLIDGRATLSGSFQGASDRLHPSCTFGGVDVVYELDLSAPQDLRIGNNASASTLSLLSIRSGQCGDGSGEISCRESDSGQYFPNLPAGAYFVVLESTSPENHNYAIDVELLPPTPRPANDVCAGAALLTLVNDTVSVPFNFLSVLPSTSAGCAEAKALYYAVELSEPSVLEATLAGASGSEVAILAGDCASTITPCGVREPACSGALNPGRYLVRVANHDTVYSPALDTLTVRRQAPPLPPPNSSCLTATPIAVDGTGHASAMGSMIGAEVQSTLGCANQAQPGQYYKLNLPLRSDITPVISGPYGASVMLSFLGGPCDAPSTIGCATAFSQPTLYNVGPGAVVILAQNQSPPSWCALPGSEDFQLELAVSPSPPEPPNDRCTRTTSVSFAGGVGSQSFLRGTTRGADDDVRTVSCPNTGQFSTPGADVFFAIEVPTPARLRITPQNVGPNMIAALHGSCGSEMAFACTQAFGSGPLETPSQLPAGTYYLRVDTIDTGGPLTPADFLFVAELF